MLLPHYHGGRDYVENWPSYEHSTLQVISMLLVRAKLGTIGMEWRWKNTNMEWRLKLLEWNGDCSIPPT